MERFAACSSGICRQQFSTWRVASEFLLLFAAPDPRGCQGEGLTWPALSSGARGSLVSLTPWKGRWEGRWKRGKWCVGACGAVVRWVRDPQGWASAVLCRGTQTRMMPTREKRHPSPHAPQLKHRERSTPLRTHLRRTHTHRVTAHDGGM